MPRSLPLAAFSYAVTQKGLLTDLSQLRINQHFGVLQAVQGCCQGLDVL